MVKHTKEHFYLREVTVMSLDDLKRKLEVDKKAKDTSPFKRTTIIVGKDGKANTITERISLKEWMEDQEIYEDNPEDPDFRAMMDGDEC